MVWHFCPNNIEQKRYATPIKNEIEQIKYICCLKHTFCSTIPYNNLIITLH